MGCCCKNKKKPEGEVVKVETGAPSTEVKIEETNIQEETSIEEGK
jgi:hypothetical protein